MDGRRVRARGRRGAAALSVLVVFVPAPGWAAVRLCLDPVRSEAVGRTEPEARRKAIEGWQELVKPKGETYAAWRIATNKRLQCTRVDGLFVCRAEARPCVISQVPPKADGVRRLDI